MEFTGKVKDISMDWQTGQAQITFTINEKSALASVDSIKNCEKLTVKAKKYRQKRSLDSNAYAWVLMQKIAEATGSDKWSIYLICLTTMADAFRTQLDDPKFKEVPFEDRFGMLVDIEYSKRKNNRQKRLIRNAGFDQPEASIMDINYTSGRRLNKELIKRLATCEYISEHRNLFITGATGCGKTYMACAFGMEACKQYYNTRYVRMPDLLMYTLGLVLERENKKSKENINISYQPRKIYGKIL